MIVKEQFSFDGKDFVLTIYDSILEVGEQWTLGDFDADIFLSKPYLLALEESPPVCLKFCYCLLEHNGRAIAKFYYQYKIFSGRASLTYNKAKGFKRKLGNAGRKFGALFLNTKGLVFGNLLVTGNHGHEFEPSFFSREQEWKVIEEISDLVMKGVRKFGWKPRMLMAKDYFTLEKPLNDSWNEAKVQPNMILPINIEWNSLDDYLDSLKSKYKKRTKLALRKRAGLEFRALDLEEMKKFEKEIGSLYRQIVDRASFNMFILNKNYFYNLKKNLKDKCIVTGVFKDNRLVAFQSNIINKDHIDAHFLGYEPQYIKTHDLYLNLLISTVKQGIQWRASYAILSRTALQIKSSIGAFPMDMTLHVKHNWEWFDQKLSSIIKRFNPDVVFDQRHPFKEEINFDKKSVVKHPHEVSKKVKEKISIS